MYPLGINCSTRHDIFLLDILFVQAIYLCASALLQRLVCNRAHLRHDCRLSSPKLNLAHYWVYSHNRGTMGRQGCVLGSLAFAEKVNRLSFRYLEVQHNILINLLHWTYKKCDSPAVGCPATCPGSVPSLCTVRG